MMITLNLEIEVLCFEFLCSKVLTQNLELTTLNVQVFRSKFQVPIQNFRTWNFEKSKF